MRMMRFVVATCLTFWIAYGVHAQQAAQPPNGAYHLRTIGAGDQVRGEELSHRRQA